MKVQNHILMNRTTINPSLVNFWSLLRPSRTAGQWETSVAHKRSPRAQRRSFPCQRDLCWEIPPFRRFSSSTSAAVSEKDWWALRGDELWVAAKRCNCAKARRGKSLSWRRRSLCRHGVSPHWRCNTLKKCARRQHGCKLHSTTGGREC